MPIKLEHLAYFALKMLNMLLQEEMKFKMELCEQQMEEVRGRREVEITQLDGKLQVWVFKAGAKADIYD